MHKCWGICWEIGSLFTVNARFAIKCSKNFDCVAIWARYFSRLKNVNAPLHVSVETVVGHTVILLCNEPTRFKSMFSSNFMQPNIRASKLMKLLQFDIC